MLRCNVQYEEFRYVFTGNYERIDAWIDIALDVSGPTGM